MNLEFVSIQLLGAIAWLMQVLSYYRKNTNKIIMFQIIGTLLYCYHYFLLRAYSGLLICAVEVIFDYLYYKTNKDKYLYIISIPLRIIAGIVGFNIFWDILPILASLIDGYSLTKKKKTVVIGAIISYSLWVIYDIYVMSISGAITNSIVVISNIFILLFQHNIFKTNKDVFDPKKTFK